MDTNKLKQAFLYSGFKYLKIELEANVSPEDYDSSVPCDYCDEGRRDCSECEAGGNVSVDCPECEARGYVLDDEDNETECPECQSNCYIDKTL